MLQAQQADAQPATPAKQDQAHQHAAAECKAQPTATSANRLLKAVVPEPSSASIQQPAKTASGADPTLPLNLVKPVREEDARPAKACAQAAAQQLSLSGALPRSGLLRSGPMSKGPVAVTCDTDAQGAEQPRSGATSPDASPDMAHISTQGIHDKVPGDEDGADTCIACWSAARTIIFLPCGHLCCCTECALPVLNKGVPCPMCRGAVVSGIAIDSREL